MFYKSHNPLGSLSINIRQELFVSLIDKISKLPSNFVRFALNSKYKDTIDQVINSWIIQSNNAPMYHQKDTLPIFLPYFQVLNIFVTCLFSNYY